MDIRKGMVLGGIVVLIAAFFLFDVGSLLTLENLKAQQQSLAEWRQANPWQSAAIFFLVYVLVTALSLPGATIMTLAIGAIFGLLVWSALFWFRSHPP